MHDPTPRPLAGTDLAPCPDCGGDIDTKVSEDSDGQWWDLDCPDCGWCAYEVDTLAPFTLAGAPWTRALWAEVERLRRIKHDLEEEIVEQGMAFNRKVVNAGMRVGLQKIGMGATPCTVDDFVAEVERMRTEAAELRLTLAAEQGRQEGAPSAGWEYREGMGADPYWRRRVDIDERIGVIVVHHADGAAVWHDIDSQPHTAATMRAAMKAADEAEAQAAAKEPTP